MIDRATERFWTLLAALPADIHAVAHKQYALYKTNPDHPNINLKPLKGTKQPVWSARINSSYRTLALRTTDDHGQTIMLSFWIGTHTEYDKLTARL
jgi:hypothetical protein